MRDQSLFASVVLLAAALAATWAAYCADDRPVTGTQPPRPDEATCAYVNTVVGWLFRVAEDSRIAPLFTAARDDAFRRSNPDAATPEAFQFHADVRTELTKAAKQLTPPSAFRYVHTELLESFERAEAAAVKARDSAIAGDTDGALRILRQSEVESRKKDFKGLPVRPPRNARACFSQPGPSPTR